MFYIRVIGNIGAISGLSGITMFLKKTFSIGLYNIPFLAFKYYICPFLMLFFSKPKAQEITRFPPDPFCPSLP